MLAPVVDPLQRRPLRRSNSVPRLDGRRAPGPFLRTPTRAVSTGADGAWLGPPTPRVRRRRPRLRSSCSHCSACSARGCRPAPEIDTGRAGHRRGFLGRWDLEMGALVSTGVRRSRLLPGRRTSCQDPYPYFDGSARAGPGVARAAPRRDDGHRLRRGDRGLQRHDDVLVVQRGDRTVPRVPGAARGRRHQRVIEQHRDELPFSDQLPSFDPPTTPRTAGCSCA